MIMKSQKNIFAAILLILCGFFCFCETVEKTGEFQSDKPLSGPYLGQIPPGDIPKVFAPGIVSRGFDERDPFFSPDGRELFYLLKGAPHTVIITIREKNGIWSKPEIAPFSGKYNAEFSLSPDGNTIIFTSDMPLSGEGKPDGKWRTYAVKRPNGSWGKPEYLGPNLDDTGYPCLASSGNIYFFSTRDGGFGKADIYMSRFDGEKYMKPVNLGENINTEHYEVDPFIAPDESYLILCSNPPDNGGLYISFKLDDGSWSKTVNMGANINKNTGYGAICPSVSRDGKYLFYVFNRLAHKSWSESHISYEEKMRILLGPGNGNNDIYWVSASIIDKIKDQVFSDIRDE